MKLSGDGKDSALLHESGARLAAIMEELVTMAKSGVSTKMLDTHARELARSGGDTASFLDYQPHGAPRPYPAALCTSVNDAVVHGIPNETPYILREGDIVTLDMGITHKGYVTDMAYTVGVGTINTQDRTLISAAKEALKQALAVAHVGNTTGDIGHAVETVAQQYGYSVARELGGHGVGKQVHEAPFIPNFGVPGSGAPLEEGMVVAIEPIIIAGSGEIVLDRDGYTYRTQDGSRAAQFEHTVVITRGAPEMLTAGMHT